MINKIQIIVILLLIPLGGLYWYSETQDITLQEMFFPSFKVMHIGDITHRVEIANTPEERAKGLSGRKVLSDRIDGMLFVFDETAFHQIWMKDMQFPIDIIWISEDLEITQIQKNVYPDSYPMTFRPNVPARYAIETDTHYSDTYGIAPGMKVVLPLKYLED